MPLSSAHMPVLLKEVIDALAPREGGIYIDGTFGRGGYTRALLDAGAKTVFGIDRDPQAIEAGQAMEKDYAPRLQLLQGPFGAMRELVGPKACDSQIDGIALDLGVSSPQLDEAGRGFSFQDDGPLDMRMSLEGETAADIVNTRSEKELADIFYQYGEERLSRRIARRILEARARAPLTRTGELSALICQVVPQSKDGLHPATRSFQALRIAVNDELGELKRGLAAAEALLKPSGRLAVVSFHSLEDRVVKTFLRDRSGLAPQASRHAPAGPRADVPTFALLTKKPVTPTETELRVNPRARSARLRVAERLDTPIPKEISP